MGLQSLILHYYLVHQLILYFILLLGLFQCVAHLVHKLEFVAVNSLDAINDILQHFPLGLLFLDFLSEILNSMFE